MSPVPRVVRNDWSSLAVPELATWRPSMTVSVIIPAFGSQETLDLALAALSHQTYPAHLLEVVVADDGSDPPLHLPEIRPANTTLVRVEGEVWGKPNALRRAVERGSGEILHLLDSDVVVYPEHVAALARWHHVVPYAVTLGHKRFVDGPWPSAEQVARAWQEGAAAELFGGTPGDTQQYFERYVAQTNQLRTADHLAFRIHVGATVAMRRDLYEAAGDPNPQLRFGNDTEHGYRLAQAGAVFIPEARARAWHLGPTHVMRQQDQVARYRLAFIADLVPLPRQWRKVGGTAWTVPLVEAVLTAANEPLERVRATVDSVLKGTERDVRINLVGPWDRLDRARTAALTDPQLELRLIAATYRGEPRVRLVTEAPTSAFPAPYLLDLTASWGLAPDSLQRLIEFADREQAGVVTVGGTQAATRTPVRLWRTAALGRAGWVRSGDESLLDAVASIHGATDVSADAAGFIALDGYLPGELATGVPRASNRGRLRGSPAPSMVEVEGVRSLARATVVVARLGARSVRAWLRGAMRRGPRGGPTR